MTPRDLRQVRWSPPQQKAEAKASAHPRHRSSVDTMNLMVGNLVTVTGAAVSTVACIPFAPIILFFLTAP